MSLSKHLVLTSRATKMPRAPPREITARRIQKLRGQWTNTNPPHPEGYVRYFICGKVGAGKTTFAARMAKSIIKKYDQFWVVSPTARWDPVMKKLFDEFEQRGIPMKLYTSFAKPETHEKFMFELTESREQNLRTLILIDDPIGNNAFTRSVNSESNFNSLTANLKHYQATIIYCSQVTHGMSRTARLNQECIIFFANVGERDEMQKMVSFLPKPTFNALMNTYANKRHTALWFNLQYGGVGVYAMNPQSKLTPISR